MSERIKTLSTSDARILGIFLGAGIIYTASQAPQLESVAKKILMSTNEDDYKIVTGINGTECYTKEDPTLSDSLQKIHLNEAYCPEGIEGETKFVELVVPSSTLTQLPNKK